MSRLGKLIKRIKRKFIRSKENPHININPVADENKAAAKANKRTKDSHQRSYPPKRCDVPFVVWFRERSGSSHLCSMLKKHPQVNCRMEDFGTDPIDDVETRYVMQFNNQKFLEANEEHARTHLREIFHLPSKACGFKFKYPVHHRHFPEILSELKMLGTCLKIIVLSRENVLKQSISRQNMVRIQNRFNNAANLSAPENQSLEGSAIQLDVYQAIRYAKWLKRSQQDFLDAALAVQAASNCEILHMNYEDLLADEAGEMKRTFAFLEVDPDIVVESRWRKATPDDLSTAVSNFDELKLAVHETDFQEML